MVLTTVRQGGSGPTAQEKERHRVVESAGRCGTRKKHTVHEGVAKGVACYRTKETVRGHCPRGCQERSDGTSQTARHSKGKMS